MHLIARWGGELIPFELLEQKAIDRMRKKATEALNEMKMRVEMALKNVDSFTGNLLEGDAVPKIEFYCEKINTWL